jgi:hypothetical protein
MMSADRPPIAAQFSRSRLAVLLPVLIVLHLGLAHAGHISLGDSDHFHTGDSAPSHHILVSDSDPVGSADTCPVPSATFRADIADLDITLDSFPNTEIGQLPAPPGYFNESSVVPKRLDGPNRQAILACFRL